MQARSIDRREVRAVALGAVVVGIYAAAVLGSGRVDLSDFARLFSVYFVGTAVLTLVVGFLVLLALVLLKARRSGREPFMGVLVGGLLRERWARDRFLSLAWPPLLFALLLSSFNAFKQMILPLAGFGADPALAAADRLLFLGHEPWQVTHAIFSSPQATVLIDRAYHGWFLPMSVGVIACAWLPRATWRLRTQYLLSYITVWIGIGSLLAFVMPSAGPCFYERLVGPSESFGALMARLDAVQAAGTPLTALANQALLIGAFDGDKLTIGGGISAMPSVHNALSALFAIAAYRVHRTAGHLLAAYAVVIWIGSIHLGWHYALDGLVAIALTLLVWRGAGRVADLLERAPATSGAQPAIA